MGPVLASRRLPLAVALAVVVFAFWPALLGGGSLVSHDIVATAPPFAAHQPDDFSLENGPGDPINIHAHWAAIADDLRSGDLGWWNADLAAGQPTLKGGVPVFNLPYVVAPDWYAPGLVAAVRAFVAIALGYGFLRSVDLRRVAAITGGIAFGFSGFMVGWLNWPHSSVAALAPGLLWAIERALRDPKPWRAAPLAAVVAMMVWANFPSVLIYVLFGAAVYTLVRLAHELGAVPRRIAWLRGRAVVFGVAAVVATVLAAPHIVGFSEYLDWADTSHRIGNPDDSSAGAAYLLTAVAPAVWGSDAVGAAWFGEGNWVEYNTHLGASVVMLAAIGLVAGIVGGPGRRRSVAAALASLAAIGVLVGYVGGPVGVALGDLTGSEGGLMTRAKVLISIGMALGAAFGVEWLVEDRRDRRREWRALAVVAGLALVVMLPSLVNWFDTARGLGVFRRTIAVSAAPLLAAAAAGTVIVARLRGRLDGRRTAWSLAVVVTVEVLLFAMPVPTIVSRSERLAATPAHDLVGAELGPGERLAGEGRTFFPATTQHFDIADARGQLLKSVGYQELLRAVDPAMLTRTGGGTPTYPNIATGTDAGSPVWDAMAVGLWAQFPDSQPPGTAAAPAATWGADPALRPLGGVTTVPEGGLRAVLLDVTPVSPGFVDVAITTADGTTTEQRWLDPADTGTSSFAVLGEALTVGSEVGVVVTAPASTTLVGVEDDGSLALGTVAGDDDLALLRVGDVILLDRPVEPVRLAHAVVVEAEPAAAAALVAAGPGADTAVVAGETGLPGRPPPGAEGAIRAVTYEPGTIRVRVETSEPGLVVVSEAHYPGWRATVDGAGADIVVSDAAFMGVVVPAGSHEVELTFEPTHLTWSLGLLAVGFTALLALLVHGARRGDLRSPWRGRG